MKIFWPHRSKAKGFSIENLVDKYREKKSSFSSKEVSNKYSDDRHLKSRSSDNNHIETSLLNAKPKRGHWANRDFAEYREAA